jgi:hypothetical protein
MLRVSAEPISQPHTTTRNVAQLSSSGGDLLEPPEVFGVNPLKGKHAKPNKLGMVCKTKERIPTDHFAPSSLGI